MHKTSRHFLRTSGFYTQSLVFKYDSLSNTFVDLKRNRPYNWRSNKPITAYGAIDSMSGSRGEDSGSRAP